MRHLADSALEKFNNWFPSTGGLYQTLVAVTAVVVVEHVHPAFDPSGFWLLYWLTVYSAVTQPVLAYGNARTAAKLDAALERIELLERNILDAVSPK